MPIKTTITPRDNQTPEIGSLWKDEDGIVYVLVNSGGKYVTLQADCLNKFWLTAASAHNAVINLTPFHGTVTIELGGV